MKPKIGVYLTDDVARRLHLAVGPGRTMSDIVNEAVDRFLDPTPDKGLGGELQKRLDQQAKVLRRLQRDVEVIAETLGVFVRYFLTITPPMPKREQAAAQKLGRERYAVFVKEIGKRLGSYSQRVCEVMQAATRTQEVAGAQTSGAAEPATPLPSAEEALDG